MKPDGPLKLVSELLDLPLVDSDGKYCGIVDDVELTGKAAELTALLVGPGAYAGRLPGWAARVVRFVAGERLTKVPFGAIRTIGPAVQLKVPAKELGLSRSEERTARWIPRKGAY